MNLSNVPTCELFFELIKREGVGNITLNPEDNFEIYINGKKVDFEVSGGPCQITVNWD